MIRAHPLLLPESHSQTCFQGYLKIGEHDYRIKLKGSQKNGGKRKRPVGVADSRYPMDLSSPTVFCSGALPSTLPAPVLPSPSDEFLWMEPSLALLLASYVSILKQRRSQCEELSDLLVEIQLIASRVIANAPAKHRKLPSPEFYSALLQDLRQVGWDRLVALDPSLSELSFAVSEAPSLPNSQVEVDEDLEVKELVSFSPRVHTVEFKVPLEYPSVPPVHVAHCPEQIDMGDAKTVAGLVHKYASELPRFGPFWDVMEDWDKHTWVLEPAHPTRACCFRRVALGNNLSLHIEVDPIKPFDVCECSFFGADAAVAPLRARWFASQDSWNTSEMPRLNLQRILSLEFPPNTARSREVFNLECGVCYSYTPPEGEGIPDQMCENVKCGRGFHHACLQDWLRAVPLSRQSFQTLFGECPYCSEPISISISGRVDE